MQASIPLCFFTTSMWPIASCPDVCLLCYDGLYSKAVCCLCPGLLAAQSYLTLGVRDEMTWSPWQRLRKQVRNISLFTFSLFNSFFICCRWWHPLFTQDKSCYDMLNSLIYFTPPSQLKIIIKFRNFIMIMCVSMSSLIITSKPPFTWYHLLIITLCWDFDLFKFIIMM